MRIIVDIVDIRCNLRSQYFDRKKIYVEKGYPIENVRIDFTNIDTEFIIKEIDDIIDINENINISQMLYDIYGDD